MCFLIELAHRWYDRPQSFRVASGVGIVSGLIVLLRTPNVLFLLIVPLLGIVTWRSARARLVVWRRVWLRILAMVGSALAVFSLQMLVWHVATGRWIINSYAPSGLTFDFLHPHVLDALFSFDPHGLFPYAPMALIAVLGLPFLHRSASQMVLPLIVVVLLDLLLISSWGSWWYGAGYGDRGFIDAFPLLAFPVAGVFSRTPDRLRVLATTGGAALMVLVFVQTVRYWYFAYDVGGASVRQFFFGG